MAQIVFTIPSDKIGRVVTAMVSLYPVPLINLGDDENPDWVPEFTDSAWAKEVVRRWIIKQVHRWETKVAKDAVSIDVDDDIAS